MLLYSFDTSFRLTLKNRIRSRVVSKQRRAKLYSCEIGCVLISGKFIYAEYPLWGN